MLKSIEFQIKENGLFDGIQQWDRAPCLAGTVQSYLKEISNTVGVADFEVVQ